ncbi:MAG: fibronectin type III domain-containing protein [Candidatus Brocadiaceae bacterium]|nr:fibronectin type III domain-containing protein [Candidatus Brocadiaceae bacterium]
MHWMVCAAAVVWLMAAGASEDLAPWKSNTHPSDAAMSHVEDVAGARHEYAITQGGTMDGENCRLPYGVWEGLIRHWESNRSVRIENVGQTDVVNPWLSNARNNFRNLQEIAHAPLEPGMSDRERAIAIWYQQITNRYHWQGDNNELGDPVRVFNVYGHNTCGNDSIALAGLWQAAGLRVAPARPLTHCISQVFFDGRWNLLDGDMQGFYLLRDNETIASEQDLVHDHDLVKRTHTAGILHANSRSQDESQASIFVYEGEAKGTRNSRRDTTMDMTLRPGEALTYRWGHTEPIKYHGVSTPRFPTAIQNGLWEYRPDLFGDVWRSGARTVERIRNTADGLAAEPGTVGTILWRMAAPYPFVGGRYEVEGNDVRVAVSTDGEQWRDMTTGILDYQFPSEHGPYHQYFLRCRLEGDARLKSFAVINDIQTALPGMPGMVVGENRFVYTDETPGERRVRITHGWVERSAGHPPVAPAAAVFPPDGAEVNGTDITFRWQPAADPDGEAIADYHWELSDRPDMRWPLSPNFRKLISRTPDRGHAQYSLPCVGLLAPGRPYYWRVRARSAQGLWGPWSETWSFVSHAPTPPIAVALDVDETTGVGTLTWKPNPSGNAPATYRVYGSDEKGFSVSDEPYRVNRGQTPEGLLPDPFPANFVAETAETRMAVLGRGLDLPNANRAWYRVVAVDANGKRSWSSAFAEAPRPLVYTTPVTSARVGTPYVYRAAAVRSLGDARNRGRAGMGYWDIEEPAFSIEQGPDWLTVDPATGLLTGTPHTPGRVPVVLRALIERDVPILDEGALAWGNYTVTSTERRRVGSAVQEFTIDVAPQ